MKTLNRHSGASSLIYYRFNFVVIRNQLQYRNTSTFNTWVGFNTACVLGSVNTVALDIGASRPAKLLVPFWELLGSLVASLCRQVGAKIEQVSKRIT